MTTANQLAADEQAQLFPRTPEEVGAAAAAEVADAVEQIAEQISSWTEAIDARTMHDEQMREIAGDIRTDLARLTNREQGTVEVLHLLYVQAQCIREAISRLADACEQIADRIPTAGRHEMQHSGRE